MTNLELAGAIFGLLSVWLTARASIWCWPTGLVSTTLFVVVFAGARLYGDVLTNLVFSGLGVYGWNQWLRGGADRSGRRIAFASPASRAAIVAVCAAGVPAAGFALRAAGSALPWWDGAILVLSLVAQFLLGRKLIESWALWIAVDVLSVGVYLARQLFAVSALYAVFLVLAIHGLRRWSRAVTAPVDTPGGPSITGGTREAGMSDKRYRVTYSGGEVVRLGGSKWMAGTVAFLDEDAAREAAARSDFKVEGLDGAAEASSPAAASAPPVKAAESAKPAPAAPAPEEKKAEPAKAAATSTPAAAEEKKAAPAKADEKKADEKKAGGSGPAPAGEEKKAEAKPAAAEEKKAEAKA